MTLPCDLLPLVTDRKLTRSVVTAGYSTAMRVDFGGTLCKAFRDLKLAACDSSWCGKLLRIVAPHSALLQGIGLESDHDEPRFSSYSNQALGTQGNHRISAGVACRILRRMVRILVVRPVSFGSRPASMPNP